MGNTLCIYDGDVQTRQIACLVGSVLSMSAYAAYTETMNWDRYERIVFVMGPRQAMFSHFAAWQPALQHKKLAFLWNDFQNIYTERIAAAIQARLGRPLDVTAFVSAENWLDDTIRAAQTIQAREKGPVHDDGAVLQAMETFLAGHNTGVLSTGWGQEVHGMPIEYVYERGAFYFFSEGGRKFIYLYRNGHAAFWLACRPKGPCASSSPVIRNTDALPPSKGFPGSGWRRCPSSFMSSPSTWRR